MGTPRVIIPTRRREELPDGFDYPLWPSAITEAMRGTPQFEDMELVFRWRDEFWQSHWEERVRRGGILTLLEAEYLEDHSPYFPKWKITVNSVPHAYLAPVKGYLLDGGLAEFAASIARHGPEPDHDIHEHLTYELAASRPIDLGEFRQTPVNDRLTR